MRPYFTEMLATEHRAALLADAETFRVRRKATGECVLGGQAVVGSETRPEPCALLACST